MLTVGGEEVSEVEVKGEGCLIRRLAGLNRVSFMTKYNLSLVPTSHLSPLTSPLSLPFLGSFTFTTIAAVGVGVGSGSGSGLGVRLGSDQVRQRRR